ncbi:RluA family pseudouridine synthase [Carboxylicivirga sp. M1479]|uniref:RluA family pseudouridine synthase n=1 Tax=Carboxylicivirga sp. M1479 TaxID=2594476 RepID=UPI0011788C5B|nr:RluA family pseudouridine synthase [Carboxylicivirga sp. M1479]TRX72123.1 RNA pseudouridine synthase [Carboxylicivirga sp. M1479]
MNCFVPFTSSFDKDLLPTQLTDPFDSKVNPLASEAADKLHKFLPDSTKMKSGKMYGVLVVYNSKNELGYLAAYSGNESKNDAAINFVPQVFDITNPNGFFRLEEQKLNFINQSIKKLTSAPELQALQEQLTKVKHESLEQLQGAKNKLKQSKAARNKKRASTNDQQILDQLIKESQTEKSIYNTLKKEFKGKIKELEELIGAFQSQVKELKNKRKTKSAQIQQQLFDSYIFSNSAQETKSAMQIFKALKVKVPPAGTGDCSAPKLLNYAFNNNLQPVALAEFWWGPSPKTEIRKHGNFYPPCKSKCEPLLNFMLQGLIAKKEVSKQNDLHISILYNDDTLAIINKPAGLLSVPGKELEESVLTQMQKHFTKTSGPLIVHRLDMATSGIMIIPKTKEAHEHIQKQFLAKTVKKRYIAILSGRLNEQEGTITLPLRVDLDDRPRQLVCYKHGKEAITHYKVINKNDLFTRIHFYPQTGRTHQLRLHAAHPMGLNTPIVGDPLYGHTDKRLMLHAEHIEFTHPTSHQSLSFYCAPDF